MAINFTPEQEKVITLRDRNILVAAAAGSGKTAVLVERIITRLTKDEHPLNIDELLIVTYTEAAAAEMKERIQSAIEKALEEDPENVHLQQQATLIHQARITTIHGFCLSVIRDYFHIIDLDPGFRIGEDGEMKLLKQDVVEGVLEKHYAEGEQIFVDFVECYASGKSDSDLEKLVLKLYGLSRSQINPKKWLADCVQAYDIQSVEELEEKPFVKQILNEVKYNISEWMENLEYAVEICDSEDGPAHYKDALYSDLQMMRKWLQCMSYQEMQQILSEVKWQKLNGVSNNEVSPEKKDQVTVIRNAVKDELKKMVGQYFYQNPSEMQQDMLAMKNNMEMLATLVTDFADAFTESKRNKNLIDFEDMERLALEILTEEVEGELVPSNVAQELQDKFAEVMIDEYQDSNLIQEAILTSVSKVSRGVYNVFMVGDVKQSIYKFRLSKPELFMEKYHTYSSEDGEKQKIDLHMNFRSRKEVLDTSNYVFSQIMTEGFGGIEYDEKAALNLGAKYEDMPDCETELLIVERSGAAKEERIEEEALVIAKRIKELVGNHKIKDKATEEYREAGYGDIVILTRSLANWGDVFAKVLAEEGVPTYTSSKEGYFQTREIKLILDYLRILDNPYQDIPLAAVLLSVFAGLNNEELAVMKSEIQENALYTNVCRYLEVGESAAIKTKLQNFMAKYQFFRKMTTYTSIQQLLWKIMEDTDYSSYMAALPGGSQRNANLEMLLSKAIAFEKTSYKGLFNFIRYIEQLHKYDVDYGEATLTDEQMNAVRLMTIHKSKGLEFPIVFVAGTGKRFNRRDANDSVIVHSEYGVGLDAIDPVQRMRCPTLLKKSIQKNILLESGAEELRVLYVAMTRPKEKLILTWCTDELGKELKKWGIVGRREEKILSYSILTKAICYMDWILPALYRNHCMAELLEENDIHVPFTNPLFKDNLPVLVKTISAEDVEMQKMEEVFHNEITKHVLEHWDTEKVYDQLTKEQIEKQFSYVYPFEQNQKIKQKLSVSELKKKAYEEEVGESFFREEEVIPLLPEFLQGKKEFGGAMRGTVYHKVLELLDFGKTYTEDSLKKEVSELRNRGYLTEEELDCVSIGDILRFLDSSVGKRLHAASRNGKFHAEQPFVLGVSSKEVYGEGVPDDIVLVQGIIDVYFEEEDGLVVLDYKTDKVFTGQELVDRYRAQLDYYAKALERLTGKSVKQKLIYSFTLQEEIEV